MPRAGLYAHNYAGEVDDVYEKRRRRHVLVRGRPAELQRRIDDWRAPLTRHVAQARQLLRKVLAERLTVTPEAGADRYSTITGDGTLTKILAGIVVPKGVASPRGSDKVVQPKTIGGRFRLAA